MNSVNMNFCLFIVKVQSNVECFLCFYEFWKDGTRGKNAQLLRQKAAQAQKTRVCSFVCRIAVFSYVTSP